MPIKKRKPSYSQYVYTDEHGALSVRVPAECQAWDQEFRLRLSKDWLRPMRQMDKGQFMNSFVKNGMSTKQYIIHGVPVRIYYKFSEMRNNRVLIHSTVVENIKTKIGIEITHREFAFRNLQIYEFLSGIEIGGVPTPRQISSEPPET